MIPYRLTRLVPLLLAAVPLATLPGCFFSKKAEDCRQVGEYQESRDLPAVEVPEGLNKPDEPNRLKIPAGPLPEQPLSASAGCLVRPPEYFKKAPPAPATAPAPKPAN